METPPIVNHQRIGRFRETHLQWPSVAQEFYNATEDLRGQARGRTKVDAVPSQEIAGKVGRPEKTKKLFAIAHRASGLNYCRAKPVRPKSVDEMPPIENPG